MKTPELNRKTPFSLFVMLFVCASIPRAVYSQTERLGVVQYTPPKGWNKTTNENVVQFSELNQADGRFCVITLYGAKPGTGNPESDFKRGWDDLVVKPLKAGANPETATEPAGEWKAIAGLAAIEVEGGKAAAFLTVFSGGRKTVSLLGVFNDKSCATPLEAFRGSMDLGKVASETSREESSPRATPPAAASMHAAELVREFETNEVRANQTYAGKRVRIHGTVNNIEIDKDRRIVLTFKSSVSTYNQARCFFSQSQSSRVAALSAHEEATVEGTVRGLGGGFDGAKAFLLLEDCVVP